jgi:hypothetical protein
MFPALRRTTHNTRPPPQFCGTHSRRNRNLVRPIENEIEDDYCLANDYNSHAQLRAHLDGLVNGYSFAKRLKFPVPPLPNARESSLRPKWVACRAFPG